MKVIYLGFVFALVLITFSYEKSVNADSSGPAIILETHAQPNTIKVNDTFSIYMTILNNSTRPIYLTSGSCTPAFSVAFDIHAKQVYPKVICTAMAILQEVDPHTQVTVSDANKPGIMYQAVQPGTATADITLSYFAKNHTAADYSNIGYTATKSFQFFIHGNNDTSQKPPTYFSPPLQQIRAGALVSNIQCSVNLNLIIKIKDHSPACVKPSTYQKLIERGWGESLQSLLASPLQMKITDLNSSYATGSAIIATVQYSGYQYGGVYPDVKILDENGIQIWDNCCISRTEATVKSLGPFTYTVEGLSGYPVINKTGTYTMVASLDNVTASATFAVTNELSSKNLNTSGTQLPASFMPCDTPYPKSNSGIPVLYMPMNSTGKICVRYSNFNDSPAHVGIRVFGANNISQDAKEISTWNDLGNSTTIPKGNSTVVYWIKTGNQAGFYGLTIFCIGTPLAVGYDNDSRIVSSDFPWLGKIFNCPSQSYQFHIESTSGIGIKYILYP
jgi:hypothetical protein